MDREYMEMVRRQYLQIQEARSLEISHLLEPEDKFLDSGSGRVESYPGRKPPSSIEEDFLGYIAVTRQKFIYKDIHGEVIIPFVQIKRIKKYRFPAEGTTGLKIKTYTAEYLFSANTPFALDLVKAFKVHGFKAENLKK
jgi:hypothetical protein